MKMYPAKRVAVIIEAPVLRRLTDAMEAAGITGYSVLPVKAGSGRSGRWAADSVFGSAGNLMQVVSIVAPERLDDLVENVFPLVEKHIGIITVTDCEVLRPERF